MEVKINAATEQGKFHNENEDCIVYMKVNPFNDVMLNIGVICDGMGGMSNAKLTACTAAEEFAAGIIKKITHHYETERKNFSVLNYRDRLLGAMIYALDAANNSVCEIATPGFGNGTTISAVVVTNDFMTAVNVGDSPIYYYSSSTNSLTLISTIHNRLSDENNSGEDMQEMYADGSRFLTHYLGEYRKLSDELLHVYTVEKMLPGDKIIIMSDGVGIPTDKELNSILSSSSDGAEIISRLISFSDTEDDKSAVIMEMI